MADGPTCRDCPYRVNVVGGIWILMIRRFEKMKVRKQYSLFRSHRDKLQVGE